MVYEEVLDVPGRDVSYLAFYKRFVNFCSDESVLVIELRDLASRDEHALRNILLQASRRFAEYVIDATADRALLFS